MNRILHANKKFIATIFVAVYLFSVVFSGVLHTHTNNFKEDFVSFSKAPVSEKIVNFGGVDDCFSLHFFNAEIGILNADTQFQLVFSEIFNPKNFYLLFSVAVEKVLFFSLRAPPSFI